MTEQQARLTLARAKGIGPQKFWRLLSRFGSAEAALKALFPALLPPLAEAEAAQRLGAVRLEGDDPRLGALSLLPDRPAFLWAKGNLDLLERPIIALVGARNASSLGERMAEGLARDLVRAGFIVISGLARGIDTAAHRGARPAQTIGVLGTGLGQSYPAQNADLQDEIGAEGLLLSEYPPEAGPQGFHFIARNRLVAGLAQAVVVVEAAAQSGSLRTARDALDLGREVLAVPGHPLDPRSEGCNRLLREGATLVRTAQDIIAALSPIFVPSLPQIPPKAPVETLLGALGPTPVHIETLRQSLALSPPHLQSALAHAEMTGALRRLPGGWIVENPQS